MDSKRLQALQASVTDKEDTFWKGILYGEFGVRKTTTALRTSRKRAILLHADRGWVVYKNHPEEFAEDRIVPVAYEGLSQVTTMLEAVAEGIEPFHDVDLIVFDTVGQAQEEYVDFLMENVKYSGNLREKTSVAPGVKIEGSIEVPGFADYHLTRNKFRPVIRKLVKAPVNVMFLAHVREPGPMDKTMNRRPNVIDSVWKVLARDSTFIGYMRKDKEGFTIDFESKATQSAKSQIPSLTDNKILASDLPAHLHKWQDQ